MPNARFAVAPAARTCHVPPMSESSLDMGEVDPELHVPLTAYLKVPLWLKTVGIDDEFLRLLLASDDWSFVIKWHALLEVAASQFLAAHFGHPKLRDAFAELPMGNFKFGKVTFLKACGFLSPGQFRFLQILGEYRNALAHDVRQISFSIEKEISSMQDKGRKDRRKEITYWMQEDANQAHVSIQQQLDFAEASPKLAVHNGCHFILYTLLSQLSDESLTADAASLAAQQLVKIGPRAVN